MVICSRCKTENEEAAKFCRECGNDLSINVDMPADEDLKNLSDALNDKMVHTEKQPFNLNKFISDGPKKLLIKIKKSIFFRKKKNTIITVSTIALVLILAVGVLNSGYIAFTAAYNMGKYDTAKNIQNWSFNSNAVKAHIEKFVIGKTNDYYQEFLDEKISYDEAGEKFEIADKFCNNKTARNKTDNLQISRTAFAKAEEYDKDGDLYNATVEYLKVIEEDKNYDIAQEKIEKNKPQVRKQAIEQMDACIAANNFNKGLEIVSDVEKIFANDSDISNYKKDFNDRKEAHRIQELKDNQEVKVINAYTFNDGYFYVFRKGTVVLQNCSDKVLKEATVVMLTFDDNGYPIDADYSMYTDGGVDNTNRCATGSINIQPGATWGNRYSWNIADEATKIKACVKSAEFYDGGTWNNPYYEHWLETEKDRY